MEPITYKKEKNLFQTLRVSRAVSAKIIFLIFLFFGARVPFIDGIYPFAPAIFAAFFRKGTSLPSLIIISLSLSTLTGGISPFVICVGSIFLFCIFMQRFAPRDKYIISALMSGCFFIASLIPKIFDAVYIYDISVLLLSCISLFCVAVILHTADFFTLTHTPLSVSFCKIYIALFFLFTSGIHHSGPFGKFLSLIICCLATLSITYKNGAAYGCVAGIFAGIVCGFPTGDFSFYISLFSLASLWGGIFSPYGKICTSLSYLLSSLVVTFFSASSFDALSLIGALIIPICTFPLIPEKSLSSLMLTASDSSPSGARYPLYIKDKLEDFSLALSFVSEIYDDMSSRNLPDEPSSSEFFDKTTMRICSNCQNIKKCWSNTYATTYCSFFVLHTLFLKKDALSFDDIPPHLINTCEKRSELIKAFTSSRELYKNDKLWQRRMQEARHSISNQLKSVSHSLNNYCRECENTPSFDSVAEYSIKKNLFLAKIPFSRVTVLKDSGEVSVYLQKKIPSTRDVESAVSKACRKSFSAVSASPSKIILIPAPAYSVLYSHIQQSKTGNTVCGDSMRLMKTAEGKFIAILSDGMGSGSAALCNSRATVLMTEKMLAMGFPPGDALEIVNSVLLLKSDETSFATVDMAVIDLHKGTLTMYKSGSACSFIKRGTSVQKIECDCLPAGTFSKADIYKTNHALADDSFLIMVSDGIISADSDNKIESIISSHSGTCRELAEKITSLSSPDNIKDDESVIVIKINNCIKYP